VLAALAAAGVWGFFLMKSEERLPSFAVVPWTDDAGTRWSRYVFENPTSQSCLVEIYSGEREITNFIVLWRYSQAFDVPVEMFDTNLETTVLGQLEPPRRWSILLRESLGLYQRISCVFYKGDPVFLLEEKPASTVDGRWKSPNL
jgi:hypothetical protein